MKTLLKIAFAMSIVTFGLQCMDVEEVQSTSNEYIEKPKGFEKLFKNDDVIRTVSEKEISFFQKSSNVTLTLNRQTKKLDILAGDLKNIKYDCNENSLEEIFNYLEMNHKIKKLQKTIQVIFEKNLSNCIEAFLETKRQELKENSKDH